MLSTFYTVTINQIAGSGDNAGFVDGTSVQQYMSMNGNTPPSSLTNSQNKTRANIRYKNVIENLQSMGNIYVPEYSTSGGDINNPPSSITFTLEVERGDEILITRDELNSGAYLSGADAITRCVSRALMENRSNYTYSVFDPTLTPANINGVVGNSAIRHGTFVTTFNVGPLVSSLSDGANSCVVSKIV